LLEGGDTVDLPDFRIKLPKGWERIEERLVPLHARPPGDELYPNLKVAVVKLSKAATLADVVTQSKKAYGKAWAVEEEAPAKVNGCAAVRMVLVQDYLVTRSRAVKYFVSAGGKVLVVTGESESDKFGQQLPLFEAVVQTLEVTKS
jgi:hypothetical protein